MSEENGFLSLADLAGSDTTDVVVLMSRLPAAGVFRVRCESVEGTQPEEGRDGKPPQITYNYGHVILGVHATIDKDLDPETLVGKKVRDRQWIRTDSQANAMEDVGLLKGRYKTVGLPYEGPMGGDGKTAGWVDGAVGAEFDIRIRHVTRDGNTRVYLDWLTPEAAEKQAA